MKYRSIDRRLHKRVFIYGGLWSNMNLPRLMIGAEEGAEYVALSYGNDGSDPVLGVEITLTGTRAGRLLSDVYWAIDRWRRR